MVKSLASKELRERTERRPGISPSESGGVGVVEIGNGGKELERSAEARRGRTPSYSRVLGWYPVKTRIHDEAKGAIEKDHSPAHCLHCRREAGRSIRRCLEVRDEGFLDRKGGRVKQTGGKINDPHFM